MKKKPPMVLVVGHLGNMGRRYSVILDCLGIGWIGTEDLIKDYPNSIRHNERFIGDIFSHIIIASPTDSHNSLLQHLQTFPGPVLCEKPITKTDNYEIKLGYYPKNLYMVNNYAFAELHRDRREDNVTWYDFYNSGKDGLAWDCLQFIVLAEGKLSLKNDSPIWSAGINGFKIDRSSIDNSYVLMLDAFISNRDHQLWDARDMKIVKAHEIAARMRL